MPHAHAVSEANTAIGQACELAKKTSR